MGSIEPEVSGGAYLDFTAGTKTRGLRTRFALLAGRRRNFMSTVAIDSYGPNFKPITGSDESTIDDKGRILVPKRMRDRLGGDFTLAFSRKSCLVLYPLVVWNALVREILTRTSMNPGADQYRHMMIGEAVDELNFDGGGRFVVPQRLREIGQLKGKIWLVGCGDYVEIWPDGELGVYRKNPDEYQKERREEMDRAYRRMIGVEQ